MLRNVMKKSSIVSLPNDCTNTYDKHPTVYIVYGMNHFEAQDFNSANLCLSLRSPSALIGKQISYELEKYFRTVCPGSSDPPEKLLNTFVSENEVYTIF